MDEVKAGRPATANTELTACPDSEISTRTGPHVRCGHRERKVFAQCPRERRVSATIRGLTPQGRGITWATREPCALRRFLPTARRRPSRKPCSSLASSSASGTSCSAAASPSRAARRILATLPDCQLVACAVHYAAARIARRGVDRVETLRELDGTRNRLLSDRESQCLIQSARGKTTSEIGQALQISERTVAFHLSNVRRKLGAANSRHAVTKAFSLKLIAAGS